MAEKKPSFLASRIKSFAYAYEGLRDMISTEQNAWIHAAATVIALGLAWWLDITKTEWALIILAIVGVWVAEAFNTVLETMADLTVGARQSKAVKRAKDMAAAAVLVAAIGALAIGLTILGPGLCQRLGGA
jgi:diacylglycerol kinase (ATP)